MKSTNRKKLFALITAIVFALVVAAALALISSSDDKTGSDASTDYSVSN